MSNLDWDFETLLNGLRSGDPDAAWELVERYGEDLRRAVRRVLDGKLRSKFDSIDFVQLAWASFFRMPSAADRCDSPDQLAAFLASIAKNKVLAENRRRLRSQKYNVFREQSLKETDVDNHAAPALRPPLPEEIFAARERLERLLQEQPEHYRKMVVLRLSGHSCRSIAEELHLDEETVRRFLNKLIESTKL